MCGAVIGAFLVAAINASFRILGTVTFESFFSSMQEWATSVVRDPSTFLKSQANWLTAGAAMTGAAAYGLRATIRERTIAPNDGVRLTAIRAAGYAALFDVMAFAIYLTIVGSSYAVEHALFAVPGLLLGVGVPAALVFGGVDIVRHFTLRWLLARAGHFPWRAVDFLDRGVSLVFLRRVGGGYAFIHRMLLEYFAALPPERFGR